MYVSKYADDVCSSWIFSYVGSIGKYFVLPTYILSTYLIPKSVLFSVKTSHMQGKK